MGIVRFLKTHLRCEKINKPTWTRSLEVVRKAETPFLCTEVEYKEKVVTTLKTVTF